MISDVADFDSISIEQLRQVGGLKWSAFPGTIGAFVAEMDFGTAPEIVQAIHAATDRGLLGYLPTGPSERMSEATARWQMDSYGWDVRPDQIHPVADVIKTLELALTHYSRPGSKVIIPTPSYMNFLTVAEEHGREVIEIPLVRNNKRSELDLDALERAFRSGGNLLLLCNPFNPVGRVFTREELVAISEIVDRHGGRVFADEVHAPIVYEPAVHVPYASVSDASAAHTVTGTSAAKAWNLAGLKCAQLIISNDADASVWEGLRRGASHGASTLGVIANTVAYDEGRPWLERVLAYNDQNRRVLGELLTELIPEVGYAPPEGTYMAWLDCRRLGLGDHPADFFREKAGVALTDGASCGASGKGFVRLGFATPQPILEQAIRNMAQALRNDR